MPVVLTYAETPLYATTEHDPKLDGISFAKHGAKVLKNEYKSRLDVDIDFDLTRTEMIYQTPEVDMIPERPTRSKLKKNLAMLTFSAAEGATPLADKIKEGNALRLIHEEEEEKKKKNNKGKGKSKSPASANSALPRSPLIPTEPMPSPTSPKGAKDEQSSARLLPPSSLPSTSDFMPPSTPASNDLAAFKAVLDEHARKLTTDFKLIQGGLEKKVEDLQRIIQAHARILHPLHRRVVLDNARDKIIRDYRDRINPDSLYPSASNSQIQAIVEEIYKVLSGKDKEVLSRKAVEVIISTGQGTIRGDGNAAAHLASETQVSDATLASSLSPSQRTIMNSVYEYAYGNAPTLGF